MVNFEELLENIPELKEEELTKIKLEDISKYHESLTLDNPLTYIIFMKKRDDLTDHDKEIIYKIIDRLRDNELVKYEMIKKQLQQ